MRVPPGPQLGSYQNPMRRVAHHVGQQGPLSNYAELEVFSYKAEHLYG